ncbi:MAG: tyrosine--tRNA ligase [Rhodospirillales bacterium]|nr:tyrosine--tRNA ligase [Rhodospirillales bacterium]MDH3792168.1 tyrosine--tRNA ligase [Rhodospirillales bacterium]MDH3910174.1 tyrosine--tRNA ligase [Rhodospirillales bacterium]MDH3918254.1 tyrosine--tRNA ligase [Rhodospirillales bacterium]MDH3966682.1 tyrosine--tRNA ligase [Rhodospirillales bacterium]
MTSLKSDFLRTLRDRGFIHQCTDLEALDAKAAKGPVTAYIGFDATADSLHVGSLVSIMLLRWLQKTGHKPIVLMGGGTTKVGDPSGKDESRQLLSDEAIAGNIASIRQVFERFLAFGDGPADAVLVNNADWLDSLAYIPFLREVGRHFTINRMLAFDSVKLRLEREQPLTFLEFNYMILQAYDFLELARRRDCALQMGGSDQWGNIVNGVELGRRIAGKELYGLTTPLITTAAGAKMGKTAAGAVWLNEARLSAYDYWQFWRNTEDGDVGRFLRLFTELPEDEIGRLEALEGSGINEAKKVLADEATKLCRGAEAAEAAARTARQTFEEGKLGAELPSIEVPRAELAAGLALFELMRRAGLAESNGAARRLIKGGGARLNDTVIADEIRQVGPDDLNAEGVVKLSAGKKRHALVRAV